MHPWDNVVVSSSPGLNSSIKMTAREARERAAYIRTRRACKVKRHAHVRSCTAQKRPGLCLDRADRLDWHLRLTVLGLSM